MAMAVSSGGGGGRRRGRRRGGGSKPMSEINVTPMVDVMLVLLIIFMVAAPLMTVGVPIDLPKTAAKQLNTEQKPVIISVNDLGAIFLGDEPTTLEALPGQLSQLGVDAANDRINVRGDGAASYGSVMQVMGALSGAGYSRIGLVTEQKQDN
ncbi:ExbD/TolR family protein [Devosia sp.]|uniref:ExbD/TolR family protein n=1 Tax=Devosia sp. TaxID=1871048 RepID=UPI0035B3AC28